MSPVIAGVCKAAIFLKGRGSCASSGRGTVPLCMRAFRSSLPLALSVSLPLPLPPASLFLSPARDLARFALVRGALRCSQHHVSLLCHSFFQVRNAVRVGHIGANSTRATQTGGSDLHRAMKSS